MAETVTAQKDGTVTVKVDGQEAADKLVSRWQRKGMSAEQTNALVEIAEDLVVVTGKPLAACLVDVDEKVTELLTDKLMNRIHDAVNYGKNF